MWLALVQSKVVTLSVIAVLVPTISLRAQGNAKNPDVKEEPWFTAKQVSESVWRIDDHGADNMYLVAGRTDALLIDTGTGRSDLGSYVKSMTKLPVTVVNTHGHPDHAGSNHQFERVYAHPGDFELIKRFNKYEQRANVAAPVKDGYVFDLGERNLEVIEVPGHTKGSICLLDRKYKILFTGDNDNALVWLFLADSTPLEVYLQSLQKLNQRADDFEVILPGHGPALDKAFVGEQIICAQNILNGSCKGEPYKSPVGDALLCGYKRARIAFNPNNLHAAK